MAWERLPLEIRLLIWDAMTEKGPSTFGRVLRKTPMHYPLTTYSTVCKEWNDFFEPKIWRRLSLTQSSLPGLQWSLEAFPHRKSLIQDIHLRIDLGEYGCETCDNPCDDWITQQKKDNETVERAITWLFSCLSAWNTPALTATGLSLEISAVSPSDKQHAFQADVYLDSEGFAEDHSEVRQHDPRHGYTNGQRTGAPSVAALRKIFSMDLYPDLEGRLIFLVPAVKTLLLRRQTRRFLGLKGLYVILRSLTQLETLVFEPWRRFDGSSSRTYRLDKAYWDILVASLPPTLRNLALFEDFNEDFNWVFANRSAHASRVELVRTPCSIVGRISAIKSIGMTTLSASYLVDARDFFSETVSGSMADRTWEWLECLTLTSPLLKYQSNGNEITAMLVDAGKTAQRMPKLGLMEIWYGMRRTACVFRYRVDNGVATISWQGTWSLSLTKPAVAETWQTVAETHTGHDLKIGTAQDKPLDEELVKSHAHAVTQLGLSGMVAHPASLEIRREADAYSFRSPEPFSWFGAFRLAVFGR